MIDALPTGMTLALTLDTTQRGAKAELEHLVSVLSDTWDVVIVNGCWSQHGDLKSFVTVVLITPSPTKQEAQP